MVLDPLGGYVMTSGQDGVLRQWDAGSGQLKRQIKPELGAGVCVCEVAHVCLAAQRVDTQRLREACHGTWMTAAVLHAGAHMPRQTQAR
jgi:hypothetical protein